MSGGVVGVHQVLLDLVLEYSGAGIYSLAAELLEGVLAQEDYVPSQGTAPLLHYYLAYVYSKVCPPGRPG